jgi:hypothetical protein
MTSVFQFVVTHSGFLLAVTRRGSRLSESTRGGHAKGDDENFTHFYWPNVSVIVVGAG